MSNEKKYTQEEIKAIVDEELRKANLTTAKELSMDEMEEASGGSDAPGGNAYVIPKTHAEIDVKWDVVQATLEKYGVDIASMMARQLQVLSGRDGLLIEYGTNVFRKRMHDALDGKLSKTDLYSFH